VKLCELLAAYARKRRFGAKRGTDVDVAGRWQAGSMKPELKQWLSQRLSILEQLK